MKKEAPAPPKLEMKAKVFQVKKLVQKATQKRIEKLLLRSGGSRYSPTSWKNMPKKQKFVHCTIIKFPMDTRLTVKKSEDKSFVISMYVQAKKHPIKQPVEKLKSWSTDLSEVLMETGCTAFLLL